LAVTWVGFWAGAAALLRPPGGPGTRVLMFLTRTLKPMRAPVFSEMTSLYAAFATSSRRR
jgi:hypothetical protein